MIVWYELKSSQSLWNVKVNNSYLIASIKMQIKCKSLRRTRLISYQSGNYTYVQYKSWWIKWMFVGGWRWKTRKIMIPCPVSPILWIVSVCQGRYQWKKKKRRKKIRIEKKPNRTFLTLCIMINYYSNN